LTIFLLLVYAATKRQRIITYVPRGVPVRRRATVETNGSCVRQRHLSLSDDTWTRLRVTAAIQGVSHSDLAESMLRQALARMGRVVDDGVIAPSEK